MTLINAVKKFVKRERGRNTCMNCGAYTKDKTRLCEECSEEHAICPCCGNLCDREPDGTIWCSFCEEETAL